MAPSRIGGILVLAPGIQSGSRYSGLPALTVPVSGWNCFGVEYKPTRAPMWRK
jgi:hypothetical protein